MRQVTVLSLGVLFLLGSVCPMAAPGPLKVCMVSGSDEYKSEISLPKFQKYLEANYNVQCTIAQARGTNDLPGLEALGDCDVALFFTRRLTITGEQLERIKKYCESGGPIVAMRTASHGFQNWLEFDKLVLGGNYQKHFGTGTTLTVTIASDAKDHPVLEGVSPFESKYSLYRNAPIGTDCQILMMGSTEKSGGLQPVTWTRLYKGARVFYTSLGGPDDFENPSFRRMIVNALFWTAKRPVEERKKPSSLKE